MVFRSPRPDSPSERVPGPPFALSLGLVLLWLSISLPEVLIQPRKGARCDVGVQGLRGWGAPGRPERLCLLGVAKPKPTGLYWGRWEQGGGCSVLPNVSCLPPTYIYLYTENSRCACVCIYGMCVYIYLYAVYIKIYTYMDLF